VGVALRVGLGETVGVTVGVDVGGRLPVGVIVGVGEMVGVGVTVAVSVGVAVGVSLSVGLGVAVAKLDGGAPARIQSLMSWMSADDSAGAASGMRLPSPRPGPVSLINRKLFAVSLGVTRSNPAAAAVALNGTTSTRLA